MKRMTLLAAFAALSSLVSCQKEEAVNGNGEMKVIYPEFTASIGTEETKTTVNLQDGKVSWESSDTIIVSDGENSAVYKVKSIDGTSGKATFEVKDNTQPVLGSGPYQATYGTEPSTSQTYSATAGRLYMTALSTSDKSFTFTVECGLMKLTLTKTREFVKSIAVTGTPTGGSQTTYILTCETAESIDTAKDFCIALPQGDYNKIEIADNTGKVCILNASSALSVPTNTICPVTIGADKINFNIFGAVFSVSGDKKVRFSKGNLYWNGSDWHLESNQYDCPLGWHASHVGHFFWSKTAAASYAESYDDGTCTATDKFFCDGSDEAHTLTVDGQSGLYALSKDEWTYLIGDNATRKEKYAYGVTVAGKTNCLVLYPDGFAGTIVSNGNTTSYDTAEEWSAAESAGVVCLPAAGSRLGSDVGSVGNGGNYWSSTPDGKDYAYYLDFFGSGVGPALDYFRRNGCSVRLVCTAQ